MPKINPIRLIQLLKIRKMTKVKIKRYLPQQRKSLLKIILHRKQSLKRRRKRNPLIKQSLHQLKFQSLKLNLLPNQKKRRIKLKFQPSLHKQRKILPLQKTRRNQTRLFLQVLK